jgi:F0F1-type ATP synthase assembly protein I
MDEPNPPHEPDRRKDDEQASRQMWSLAGLGVEFAAAVGGLTILGWWIDRTFDTQPTWTIVGCAVGFVGGLRNLIVAARKQFRG